MKSLSEKQLAANRENAKRSTGPRTSEGKARAALNSRKHGLTAATVSMLRLEDHGELDNLRSDALDHYHPQTSQEIFAVERIAVCQLQMIRSWRLEAGMFIACVDRSLNDDGTGIYRLHAELYTDPGTAADQNRNFAIASGFQRMAKDSPMWSLTLRYQAQVERQYRRAVEDLQRLIRERNEDSPGQSVDEPQPPASQPPIDLPNEPISDPELAENKPQDPGGDEPENEPGELVQARPPRSPDPNPQPRDGNPDPEPHALPLR